ncbi:MAG: aldolase [Burkholderiaceae bacterium]
MSEESNIDQARIDLACALRQASRLGLGEGVCNHFSLAVPGRDDRFLINPQGLHWSEIRAADIVVIDPDGNRIEGTHTVEPTAFFIHARIHRANARALRTAHAHAPCHRAVPARGPALAHGQPERAEVSWPHSYDRQYNGLVLDDAEGDRIVAALGDAEVLFLANHGVIVTGPSVAWAFDDLYYLERAAMVQVLAEHTGRPMREIPEEVAEQTARQMIGERQQSDLHFAALARELDRLDPLWSSLDRPNPTPGL